MRKRESGKPGISALANRKPKPTDRGQEAKKQAPLYARRYAKRLLSQGHERAAGAQKQPDK